ncbi:rhamnosyl/mannosyltransferase [Paraburkholderia sp. BL27I4N3]|nr:rhamnosyl/mannosyltransferase [Paraburkholderia sp. BL27I4N3]
MRVLHFYRTYLPDTIGGAEQSIYHLCRAGADLGIRNTVLTLTTQRGGERFLSMPGHEVERVRSRFKVASVELSWRAVRRFRELSEEADILHLHFPWPMADIAYLAAHARKPTVVTYHADIRRQPRLLAMYRPLMHRFLGGVDRIVATSPQYAATSEVLKLFPKKVEVVPLGLTSAYYPVPDDALMRSWSERIGGPFFLFVGVFRYYKGLPVLIEAIRQTGYPLVLVGDGPLTDEIRALVAQCGASNVHFAGRVSEVDKVALIRLSRALVMPSPDRAEAFGISLLEAAMMGKPMITCEIGTGTSFVNADGETGLVVAPDNPGELAQAMHELWEDSLLCERMGRRATQRFENLFTAHRTAAAYRAIYQKVIDERNSGRRTVMPMKPPHNGPLAEAPLSANPRAVLEKQ